MSHPRIYSDANPIIELAKYSRGNHNPLFEPDALMLRNLLNAANNGDVSLFTSSISVAECVAARDDWGPEVQEFMINTLTSGRMFKLVQDSIFVAERARDLRWKHDLRLAGMDAIHVASALEARCTEFHTWDADMGKPKVAHKISKLKELGIEVLKPSQTKLLPSRYLPSSGLPQ